MRALIVAILLPFIEIAGLVLVGQALGVWPVLALVALAAVAGVILIRGTGPQALATLRGQFGPSQDPGPVVLRAALRLFAGVLLIVPGFLTDLLALVLLVPALQVMVMGRMRARMAVMAASAGRDRRQDMVIDGDFHEVPPKRPTHEPSGWTRH